MKVDGATWSYPGRIDGVQPGDEVRIFAELTDCLLYTSDAADERSSVDLGGRRIIKKKKQAQVAGAHTINTQHRDASSK